MKRKLASIMSILIAVTMAAGCSGKTATTNPQTGSTDKPAQAPAQSKGPITINYWHAMGAGVNGDTVKLHVKQFNEKYAGKIEVVETFQGNYDESTPKIMQALAAKTQPELAMMDTPRIPQFSDLGVCEDLTPYIEKDKVDMNDFIPGLMGYLTVGKQTIALPTNRSTPVLYFNKNAFKEVGLDPSKAPETWEDVKNYSAKLIKKDGSKTVRYGISYAFDFHWWVSAWALQQGSRVLDEAGKKMITAEDGTLLNALKFWNDLNKSGAYRKPASANAGTDMLNAFYLGEIGMIYQSTGSMGSILQNTQGKFEVGVGFLPKNKEYGVATGGASVFITKQSDKEKKEAAWEFLKFITSTEIATDFSVRTGYLPTRKSCVETETIKKLWAEKPQYKVAYDQLKYAKDTFRSTQMTVMHNEGNKIFSAFITEESLTPEQTAKEITDMANRLLQKK